MGEGTAFSLSECVRADPALLADIDARPRDDDIVAHTPTFPGGEIRGQLTH